MSGRTRTKFVFAIFSVLAVAPFSLAFETPLEVNVDCSKPIGQIRALNGVNNGPLDGGGLVDLSDSMSALSIPLVRLHDVHWPASDVVDMHVVFPNPQADPSKAESYDFSRTDEYIASIVKLGSKIVYRLGESIDHHPLKKYVIPPADPVKWSAACLGIVRHYNDGWADGFHYGIQYWEIWNEPENRPAMWTGSDADYFNLYVTASKALKEAYPGLKVGGPAIGYLGAVTENQLTPSPFLSAFLDRIKADGAPLDFFSWHIYSNDPSAIPRLAGSVRALLDQKGFSKSESHLNEWNYVPDNGWRAVTLAGQGIERQRWYESQGGADGAAFIAAVLMEIQDSPLDAANFYRGDTGGFGLFTADAVPKKSYFAFKAFAQLLKSKVRKAVNCDPGVIACAGSESDDADSTLRVLISTSAGRSIRLNVSLADAPAKIDCTVSRLDADHNLSDTHLDTLAGNRSTVDLETHGPTVLLATLTLHRKAS